MVVVVIEWDDLVLGWGELKIFSVFCFENC